MPRTDRIDKEQLIGNMSKLKENLMREIAYYEKIIAKKKQELDAIAIIEKSDQLSMQIKEVAQPNLFIKPTIKQRLIDAVNRINDNFTRAELFESIKNDGLGEVNEKSLTVYFPELCREDYITEVEKPSGRKQGVYTKGITAQLAE